MAEIFLSERGRSGKPENTVRDGFKNIHPGGKNSGGDLVRLGKAGEDEVIVGQAGRPGGGFGLVRKIG